LQAGRRWATIIARVALSLPDSVKEKSPRKSSNSTPKQHRAKTTRALRVEDLVGYNLRRAYAVLMQRFRTVFAPRSIRPVQLSILGLIHENPGITQSDLGRKLKIERANVVTLIDQLERRRLIERRSGAADRRARLLQLTPAGQHLTAEILEEHARLEEDVAQRIGAADLETLLRILRKIHNLPQSPYSDDDEG
jgi:DNA-binding MarR family transcriptional regulator